jgi:hypothetical protein
LRGPAQIEAVVLNPAIKQAHLQVNRTGNHAGDWMYEF